MSRKHRSPRQIGKPQNAFIRPLNINQIVKQIANERIKQLVATGALPEKQSKLKTYQFTQGGNSGTVEANHMSEARAMVKHALGLPKRKRLPPDVEIIRV